MRDIIFLATTVFLLVSCAESKSTQKVSSSEPQKLQQTDSKLATECKSLEHPKEKAECLLKQVIADGSNAEINGQVQAFTTAGLSPSTEVSSSFVGGTCAAPGDCTWSYLVSTDYYTVTTFKSVVALVEASNGQSTPRIKRVLQQTEL